MGTAISIKCCVGNAAEVEDVEEEKESSTVKLCPLPWHSRLQLLAKVKWERGKVQLMLLAVL